jgi:hypothetical protein
MIEKVGEFSEAVITALGLDVAVGTAIYVGRSNAVHMATDHEREYYRFYDKIPQIIAAPDYVRLKKDDYSIDFVKNFGKHIKLAVRIAGDGEYYARSLYFIETNRVENLVKKGELKPLTNE